MTNRIAFLTTIAVSELGQALLDKSDNGYNVIVGSTPDNPILFDSYASHPNKLVRINNKLFSTAAGRYQVLYKYWLYYRDLLKLKDFSPASQDAIALQIIKECKALDDIDAGRFSIAVAKCSHIWASFPLAGYMQHENTITYLQAAYTQAGGTLA